MEQLDEIKETLLQHGYEYIKYLGKGGFSSVLLCRSIKYNQNFAIKRAIKHHLTEEEYSHLVNLHHSNIIRLYDSFSDAHAQYLVMEYCPNGTILDKGKLSNEKFKEYAKQILEAISFCHSRNIAHRDIKPENIFLDQYDHIKVADFGMAKQFEDDSKSTEKCGSLMYIAPDFFLCHQICPFKADVWALGITFYYMITGNFPFRYSSRDELMQLISRGEIDFKHYEIPPKIQFLIKKMTIKDQSNRPTVDKLLEMPLFDSRDKKTSILISKSSQKISIPRFRTQSNIKAYKSVTIDSLVFSDHKSSTAQKSSNSSLVEHDCPVGNSLLANQSLSTAHSSSISKNESVVHSSNITLNDHNLHITPRLSDNDNNYSTDSNSTNIKPANNQSSLKDINSYRRINLFPRIRRVNGRFQPVNSF